MLQSLFLLPLCIAPVIVPVTAQIGPQKTQPSSYVEVGKVPLPQLSPQQWKMLGQQQGPGSKPLRLDIGLSIDHGQVYFVNVLRGTGYPDIDTTIVKWIAANWRTAPWFGVGTQNNAVSFDVDPIVRQVRFRTGAG
jgi:hypothetical protein